MTKAKAKKRAKKVKAESRCSEEKSSRSYKASERTLLLSLPKLPVRAKYDYEYFKSWDVKYNDGKGSRFERPSIRDESFQCPPRTLSLSVARQDRVVKKYKPKRKPISNVSRAALKAEPTEKVLSLAGPMMRRLLVVRRDYSDIMPPDKRKNVDTLIQEHPEKITAAMKSVFEPRKKKRRWTRKDWENHRPYITKLSTPKRCRKPPDTRIKARMPLEELLPRIYTLSEPLYHYEKPQVIRYGHPSPKALNYVISERLQKIAMPLPKKYDETPYDYSYISPNALKYKPTPRILEMAQAKTTAQAPDADFKENAFQVSPNALKYKPSKRILEMAQPRGS